MGGGTRGVVLPLSHLHLMIVLILPLLRSLLERKSMGSRLAFLKLFFSLWFSISRPNHFLQFIEHKVPLKPLIFKLKEDKTRDDVFALSFSAHLVLFLHLDLH